MANWLLACTVIVLLIIPIGGITRLTESGLSITEWKPVSGVLPPMSATAWEAEFARYRGTTEYQLLNQGMTLGEFRSIWFWEYIHRIWGRLVGLVFAVPYFFFLARGAIPGVYRVRLFAIVLLIGAQGALGWFMVRSGLVDRTDVSQYRLTAHLSLALFIFALILWHAVGMRALARGFASGPDARSQPPDARSFARRLRWMIALVALTIVSGGFVAGLNAGTAFNTFPLMGGQVVPPGYSALQPWGSNLFENPAAVQFNHRLLALVTLAFVLVGWWQARHDRVPREARRAMAAAAVLCVTQVLLGIATLLSVVAIPLAAAHQTCAVLLLAAVVVGLRHVTPPPHPIGSV